MKYSNLLLLLTLLIPTQSYAITLPDGPNVTYDSGFEGTWSGEIPTGCAGVEESTPKRKTKVSLQLCRQDSDTEIRGSVKTKQNLKLLQEDASYRAVGKKLRIIDSMSLDTENGSRSVMTELKGKNNRTTNLILIISDGLEEDDTAAGNLVGTFGNCGINTIFTKVKDSKSCKFKKKRSK